MDYKKYYRKNITYITHTDDRIRKILDVIRDLSPESLLDIGCGNGYLLKQLVKIPSLNNMALNAVDIYNKPKIEKLNYKNADITLGLPYSNNIFKCVILGEVIEHVPNPDFVLREIYRVLKPGGYLVISTPNLVSWANRLLVLLGIQPFYTETSSERKFGRIFKFLGQGNKTEGHLKIFTNRSLYEILTYCKFKVIHSFGVMFFFPWPISIFDKMMTYFPGLSSGLLYVAKKEV